MRVPLTQQTASGGIAQLKPEQWTEVRAAARLWSHAEQMRVIAAIGTALAASPDAKAIRISLTTPQLDYVLAIAANLP